MWVIPFALRRWVMALGMGVLLVGWANAPAVATRESGEDTRLPAGLSRIGTAPVAGGGLTPDVLSTVTVVAGPREGPGRVMERGNQEVRSSTGTGVLVGKVTRAPMSPVVGAGHADAPVGVPGARIVIVGMDGQEIHSVMTGGNGGYSVRLPPGTYRVELAALAGGTFTKDVPTTVTITEGRTTRLDIRIDTGIR